MADIKIEPTDFDDMEVCYGHKICNLLKRDFEELNEDLERDSVKIKLYINQHEMVNLANILFYNEVPFPMGPATEVSTFKNNVKNFPSLSELITLSSSTGLMSSPIEELRKERSITG